MNRKDVNDVKLYRKLMDMIRESKTEEILDIGEKVNVMRKAGKIYIEDVEFCTDEDVRVRWPKFPTKLKLLSELDDFDFEVLYDGVILRPIENKAFIKTSLQIPEGALGKARELSTYFKEMPFQGIVVAVGPGWITETGVLRTPPLEIGDHVAVRTNAVLADFIYKGILYYECKAAYIIGKYPESFTNARDLKFEVPNSK